MKANRETMTWAVVLLFRVARCILAAPNVGRVLPRHQPRTGRNAVLPGLLLAFVLGGVAYPLQAATKQYVGSLLDNLWSHAGNWDPAGVPMNGDNLLFGGTDRTTTNDLVNLTVNSLQFSSGSWLLGGNPLGVAASIVNSGDGEVQIFSDIRLESFARFSAYSTLPSDTTELRFRGAIDLNGRTLVLVARAYAEVEFSGPISGDGPIRIAVETSDYFSSAGTVKFSGNTANSFTGSVTLESRQDAFTVVVGANLVLDKQSGVAVPGALSIGTNASVKLNRSHQIADTATVTLYTGGHLARNVVTNPASGAQRFYRLLKP